MDFDILEHGFESLTINGITYYPDRHMSNIEWIKRTWIERIFSFPWNPFKRLKMVEGRIIYFLADGKTALVTWKTFALLKEKYKD